MKKTLFAISFLVAALARGQGTPVDIPLYQADRRLDGGPVLQIPDFVTPVGEGTFFAGPCPGSGAGPATFRLFCLTDNVVVGQSTSPGSAQNWNFNITGGTPGKGLANKFEVPSLGTVCGTSLGCIVFSSVDGRVGVQTNAGNNTSEWTMGGVGSSNADLKTVATETIMQTVQGNAWPLRLTQWRIGTSADTAATVALSTTATFSSSYRACDTTSNLVNYNLPNSANTGAFFFVKHVAGATNACTITRGSSDAIDGLTLVTLTQIGDWVLIHDSSNATLGTAWQIVAGNISGPANTANDAVNCSQQLYSVATAFAKLCQVTELTGTFSGATFASGTMLPANTQVISITFRNIAAITGSGLTSINTKITSGGTGASYVLIGTATVNNTNIALNNTSILVPALTADSFSNASSTLTFTPVGAASFTGGQARITIYFWMLQAPQS